MLLTDAQDEFLFDCECKHLAKGTIRNYKAETRFLVEFLELKQVTEVEEVKAHHIRDFMKQKQDSGSSACYVNDILKVCKTWFHYLVDEDYIEERRNPAAKVKNVRQPKTIIETFSVQEMKSLINLAILLLINVIYFGVWGLDHSASAWISYVFIHFSFLVVLVAPFLAEKGTQYVMSRNSIYTITSTYFAVEFVIGTIFIVWSPAGYKLPLFSQFAMMIGFVVALFINAIADTYTAQSAERHQDEMVYIRGCSMKLKELLSEVKGKKIIAKFRSCTT